MAASTRSVLAYSNGAGPERSLVLYHTRFASTERTDPRVGRVRAQDGERFETAGASVARRGARPAPNDPAAFVAFREARTGLEYLRSCREIWERGLDVSLGRVRDARLLGVPRGVGRRRRAVGAAGGSDLAGSGVPSLDDALREIQLEPGPRAAARDLRRRPGRLRSSTGPRPARSSTSSNGGSPRS